jgi:hypothetical protein
MFKDFPMCVCTDERGHYKERYHVTQ